MDQKLLAIFEVVIEGKKEKFSIYGEYEVETGKDCSNNEYIFPQFYSVSAKRVVDKTEMDYMPPGETWAGRKYTPEDMIQGFMASMIRKCSIYTNIYLDAKLQEIVAFYDESALTVNGLDIPKRILDESMYCLYELTLVTQEFIYYIYDDSCLMLCTKNHEVVSDNYFASVGYWDSVEDIKTGKETLLWGKLPPEE